MASYRYRATIPAQQIGATLNDETAKVWVLAKPVPADVTRLTRALADTIIVMDVCDPHFHTAHYQTLLRQAHLVTVPTEWMADYIRSSFGREATVIPDPYEFPARTPHVFGTRCLWFGHPTNLYSLERVKSLLHNTDLHVMTAEGCWPGGIPWSLEGLQQELQRADCVLLPETAPYKSANRAVEAIRSGCLVVAEPHPSLRAIPDIWLGNLAEGLQWTRSHLPEANARVTRSQAYVSAQYSPERVGNAWRTLLQGATSILGAGENTGTGGSMWM